MAAIAAVTFHSMNLPHFISQGRKNISLATQPWSQQMALQVLRHHLKVKSFLIWHGLDYWQYFTLSIYIEKIFASFVLWEMAHEGWDRGVTSKRSTYVALSYGKLHLHTFWFLHAWHFRPARLRKVIPSGWNLLTQPSGKILRQM